MVSEGEAISVRVEVAVVVEVGIEVEVAAVIPAGRGSDDAEESEAVVAGIVAIDTTQTEIVMDDDDEVVVAIDSTQTEIVNDDADDETNPMDVEQPSGVMVMGVGGLMLVQLAFQSIRVVYGDIGTTSPPYVSPSTFSRGIKHEEDIFRGIGLIYYTLTLILLIKYIYIVLRANYNRKGMKETGSTGSSFHIDNPPENNDDFFPKVIC